MGDAPEPRQYPPTAVAVATLLCPVALLAIVVASGVTVLDALRTRPNFSFWDQATSIADLLLSPGMLGAATALTFVAAILAILRVRVTYLLASLYGLLAAAVNALALIAVVGGYGRFAEAVDGSAAQIAYYLVTTVFGVALTFGAAWLLMAKEVR